jgi:hypothetical protein
MTGAAEAGQKYIVPARRAKQTNQGRTPFICSPKSPPLPQFQQSAGSTPFWSLWLKCSTAWTTYKDSNQCCLWPHQADLFCFASWLYMVKVNLNFFIQKCRGGHPIFFSLFAIDGSLTFSLLIDFDKSTFLGIFMFASSINRCFRQVTKNRSLSKFANRL